MDYLDEKKEARKFKTYIHTAVGAHHITLCLHILGYYSITSCQIDVLCSSIHILIGPISPWASEFVLGLLRLIDTPIMSDIRGFFGGNKGAKVTTPKKEKASAKDEGNNSSSRKRKKDVPEEPDLCDTPESNTKEKKSFDRLKSGSERRMELDGEDSHRMMTPPPTTTTPNSARKGERAMGEAFSKSPAKAISETAVIEDDVNKKTTKSPTSAAKKSARSPSSGKKIKPEPTLSSSSSGRGLPFDGKKFVVTGSFENMSRETVEDMILSYGGKVSSAVSGKTDYCLAGTGETMNGLAVTEGTKYKAAVEKGAQIMEMPKFLEIIDQYEKAKPPQAFLPTPSVSTKEPVRAPTVNPSFKRYDDNGNPISAPISSANGNSFNNYASTMGSSGQVGEAPPCKGDANGYIETNMWVDKYKPSKIEDVIGANDIVSKLSIWLQKWDAVHIKKNIKIPFSKENPGAKAVLISGPPGIGKTTISTLCGKKFGYEVLEMNASDARGKKAITEQVADVVCSRALSMDGTVKKRMVIMDEVDGMGGSDRGGIPELIKVIKSSMSPIICICNDRQHQKIKSLANYCFDLRMRRPTKNQIAKRIMDLAANEGLHIEPNAAEALAEQAGNDIRQTIHATQMWRAQSNSMTYSGLKDAQSRIEKDKILRQTPFDACGLLLSGARDAHSKFNDRFNSFFIDYDLVPLLLQQNYIDSARNGVFKNSALNDGQKLEALSKCSDAISDMELVGAGVRGQDQHWELLPAMAAMGVHAGFFINGYLGFPAFPQWLGKNSTAGKSKRLTQEIVHHTSLSIGQGFNPIRLDYIPFLRHRLLDILQLRGSEGAQEVIDLLDAYGLSKEDFSESLKDLQMVTKDDKILRDRYEDLDSKVKAALTKLYNAQEHKSQALVASQGMNKKTKRGAASDNAVDDVEDDGDDGFQDTSDTKNDDVGDVAAFIKTKKKIDNAAKRANRGEGSKKSSKKK